RRRSSRRQGGADQAEGRPESSPETVGVVEVLDARGRSQLLAPVVRRVASDARPGGGPAVRGGLLLAPDVHVGAERHLGIPVQLTTRSTTQRRFLWSPVFSGPTMKFRLVARSLTPVKAIWPSPEGAPLRPVATSQPSTGPAVTVSVSVT